LKASPPRFWHADSCYVPPCIEPIIIDGTPLGDTEEAAKAIVLWYKGQGAGADYEADFPTLQEVLRGLSERSSKKLAEDEIFEIVSDNLHSWRTLITCDEIKKVGCLGACCVPSDCRIAKERLAPATGAKGYTPLIELGEHINLKSLALWHVERMLLEAPDNQMVFDAGDGNNPYFWLQCGSHKRLLHILSSEMVDELARRILEDERNHGGMALSSTTVKELIPSIRAMGRKITQSRGKETVLQMAPRIREIEGAIWYDLGWSDWTGLKITPGKISMEPLPVGFLRRGSMVPQVEPEYAATVDDIFLLGEMVNVPDEGLLFSLVWTVSAFISSIHGVPIPKTILWISGPHGSAKTTMAEFILGLVDPDQDQLKNPPEDVKDLASVLKSYHATILDNVTKIEKWLSDALCQVSTGGALTKRALYTDFDLTTARFNSRIIITSLGTPRIEADLNERTLFIYPDPVEEKARKSKVSIDLQYKDLKPWMFGGVLRTVTEVLKILPDLYQEAEGWPHKPRMLDFAIIGEACIRVWGFPEGAFLQAYNLSLDSESTDLISEIPIVAALKAFMANHSDEPEWTGLVSKLLEELTQQEKGFKEYGDLPEWWPKSSKGFGRMLSKYSADLLREGYKIKGKRHTRKGEEITIIKERNLTSSHQNLTEEIDISKYIGEKMRFVRRRIEESNRNIVKEKSSHQSSPHLLTNGQSSLSGEREVSCENSENSEVLVPIYITNEVPKFVGIDGRTYGPFRPDEVASLPKIHAMNLISRGMVRRIS